MSTPVGAMFGRIAGVYDLLNHLLSLGIDIGWRKQLAALIKGSLILDLAAGTLDVAIAVAKLHPQTNILALDFCEPMLRRGLPKLEATGLTGRVYPCVGDALHIPVPDNYVDTITIAFGIRNIQPRASAFREMLRVLVPGGRLCILEFGSASERIWGGSYNWYLSRILPRIGRLVAKDEAAYQYLARTIKEFPTAANLVIEMQNAGFESAHFQRLTGGIVCLHWGEKTESASPPVDGTEYE